MSGLDVPVLKITNKQDKQDEHDGQPKPIAVIIGRVNPYQTYSSFVLHGAINVLLTSDPIIHKLRSTHEVWVLPMLNPDGVAVGNYLCNI